MNMKQKNKTWCLNKKVTGWTVIAVLAAIDFAMVQSLILESNAAEFVAILGAILFCVGFEGGPAFLGMGLVEFFDKTRKASGTGRIKSLIYMIVGSVCTIVTFVSYFLIRRDAILAAGGFNGMRYEGYYGDLILLIVPFITSCTAFGIALWFSTNGIDHAIAEVKNAQEEFEEAMREKNKAHNHYANVISTVWSRHFPEEKVPACNNEAAVRIKGKLSKEMVKRMSILLPQIISETNLITPFTNSFKEAFRNDVQDSDYLSAVSISNFNNDSLIGEEYAKLQDRINYAINSIVGSVNLEERL